MKVLSWVAAASAAAGAILLMSGSSSAAPRVAATDAQSSLVEDFTHPGAEQILAQWGLKVYKGDGHLVFATAHYYGDAQCDAGQIQVEKSLDVSPYGIYYCFRTLGTQGFLTLEVPGTFGVRGGDKALEAKASLPTGEQKTYDVPANGFVAIDPGTGSEPPKAILVELRFPGAA
jgi:hypothetical protein